MRERSRGKRSPSRRKAILLRLKKQTDFQNDEEYMRREEGPREGETTYYADGWGEPEAVHSDMLITSVRVKTEFKHDHVDIWNRGGGSGRIIVKAGDGEKIAARLLRTFSREDVELLNWLLRNAGVQSDIVIDDWLDETRTAQLRSLAVRIQNAD